MAMSEFLKEWAVLSPEEINVNRRLFPELSLEVRVGREGEGRPMMAVQTPQKMVDPPQVAGIEIYSTASNNGVNWLVIALEDQESIQEFALLCQDLIDQVRESASSNDGLRNLLRCLDRWKSLFLPRRSGVLSDNALRALMAEVVALRFLARKRGSLQEAVRAWVGPTGSPQDFQFELESEAFEVKAVHRDQTFFTVSSIEQLDSKDYAIQLLLVQLEDLGPSDFGGIRIVELIKKTLWDLQTLPNELVLFQSNLKELGFSLAQREYQSRSYVVDKLSTYAVAPGFPHLSRAELPPAVVSAKYQLESSLIQDFVVSEEELSFSDLMGAS